MLRCFDVVIIDYKRSTLKPILPEETMQRECLE